MIRIIVIVALLLIVGSLGSALYYLYHDRGQGTRMVKALAIRVALSACLLIFLVVSYELGWIGESCGESRHGAAARRERVTTSRRG